MSESADTADKTFDLDKRKEFNDLRIGALERCEDEGVKRVWKVEVRDEPDCNGGICISSMEELGRLPDAYQRVLRPFAVHYIPKGKYLILTYAKKTGGQFVPERRKTFPSKRLPVNLKKEILEMPEGDQVYLRVEDLVDPGVMEIMETGQYELDLVRSQADASPQIIRTVDDLEAVCRKFILSARGGIARCVSLRVRRKKEEEAG